MHLVSLEVKGLKSLRDANIEGLEHYNVFVGKNDSGKSSILEAIRLLGALVQRLPESEVSEIITDKRPKGRVQTCVVFRLSDSELGDLPGIAEWRSKPEVERLRHWCYEFEMRVGFDGWGEGELYVLECGPKSGRDYGRFVAARQSELPLNGYQALKPELVAEVLRRPEQSIESALDYRWPGGEASGTPIRAGSEGQGEPFYVALLRSLVRRMCAVHPVRSGSDEMEVAETHSLDPSGSNLTQVLETWRSSQPHRFQAIQDLLMEMFQDLTRVHLPREGANTVIRVASGRDLEPLESFRLSHVGMGVQQALVVATAVLAAEDGAIVLLEEPENNLHAGAQRVLAQWLREHSIKDDKQILITTHSTIFARNEDHCSTYLVRLHQKEGTKVTKLEAGDEAAVKEELGLRNVDLYGCSMVVLCEGDSEMVAMPIVLDALARKAGHTLPALGLAWRNLGGSGNSRVKWVEEFLKLLKDIDVQPYIMADDDPNVREGLERLVRREALDGDACHIWAVDKAQLDRNVSVTSEFEDNWTNEQLVDVVSEMAGEDGIDLELDATQFAKLCGQSEKRTSKVLEDYCWIEKRYDLDKKELNRRLALLVAEELSGETGRTVKEYEFEKVAHDIFRKLGGLDGEDTAHMGRRERP